MAISVKQKAKVAAWAVVAVAVATSPITVSAAGQAATSNTSLSATVTDVISMTSGPSVTLSITPTSGGNVSSASNAVTVTTNNTAGYTLDVKKTEAATTLVSGANTLTSRASTTTAAALANGEWGWAVPSTTTGTAPTGLDTTYTAEVSAGSSATKWVGVNGSAGAGVIVKQTSSTASADPVTVWFAAKANSSTPSGAYTGGVTYTATTR